MGVLDPCKVTRTALQNAASIAGVVLTTDFASCVPASRKSDAARGAGSGPCLPVGRHRCFHKLFALDTVPARPPPADEGEARSDDA
jgi:hypothetical protein